MRTYVTIFGESYLHQGLALLESLAEFAEGCPIVIVALDAETAEAIGRCGFGQVSVVLHSSCLTSESEELRGRISWREFVWATTPAVITHVLSEICVTPTLVYMDADTCLVRSDSEINARFEDSGRSVFITPHFYAPRYDYTDTSGRYCVQYLIFRKQRGLRVARDWAHACLKAPVGSETEPGIGDQRFLAGWDMTYPGEIYIAEDIGEFLAPWNATWYRPSGCVVYHFQGFAYIGRGHCRAFQTYKIPGSVRRQIYAPYLTRVSRAHRLLLDIGHRSRADLRSRTAVLLTVWITRARFLLSIIWKGTLDRVSLNTRKLSKLN